MAFARESDSSSVAKWQHRRNRTAVTRVAPHLARPRLTQRVLITVATMLATTTRASTARPARASNRASKRVASKASSTVAAIDGKKAAIVVGVPAGLVAFAPIPAALAAADKDAIESFVSSVDDSVNAVVGVFARASDAATTARDALSPAIDRLAPLVEEAVKDATPFVSSATEEVSKATKQAAPLVKKNVDLVEKSIGGGVDSALRAASSSAKSAGVDVDFSSAARGVSSAVERVVPAFADALDTTLDAARALDGATLTAVVATGAVLFATSPLWVGPLAKTARGYAGDVSAVAAFDDVREGALLVDVRDGAAQDRGVPEVRGGSVVVVETEQVGARGKLEIDALALIVASLKKANKGKKIIVMGPKAVPVAIALSSRGFGNVFVMEGGFDKRRGWLESGLPTN